MLAPLAATDLLPKIIMGVDPGTQIMGYAMIEVQGSKVKVLRYDVIEMKKLANHALKLKRIYDRMVELIDEFLPDELAIEAPFYGVNAQSMLKLGRAQGVAIAACLSRQIPYVEYAPTKVKQSVTGSGAASKEQVAHMLRQTLQLPPIEEAPKFLDATDALAVAMCHHYQKGNNQKAGGKSWGKFLADNPGKLAAPVAGKKAVRTKG
ncbi:MULTISPECIES: crossover junction endodeoxyribonuclease RuvC [Hymenobacter]|uniref:Crossover junction endodeoxyribonuclease RuvC n=2 Tax=Hymenobacter TaxID=89966 RepID=A0ABS6X4I9_9BACT|nr:MULTISPECIES: crossover junction endodeoxyribonuclease RuvC [Hymenobacter]MBO3270574.1 crossover junction endodeoxyribonuclease RuvC [Hymenobacter defluvii]MBW3130746.1 crossover junction endodeoxyribonuclease RuvC [Hymenobacter profundi]QNE39938.1 crossover junction endodeoxyribonuclease RuvC [Hymenobacter sp. NBH84]